MKPYVSIVIACAVLSFLAMEILSRPAEQQPAPLADTRETQGNKPAAVAKEEVVTRLSFNELTSNPKRYVGERVTVDEKLTLWSIQSYHEWACSSWPVDAPGPCIPRGGPRDPRCEYMVSLQVFAPNSPVIQGCVPRSKIGPLAGAWGGEQGVRFVGVVSPNQDVAGWVFIRDMLIIPPRENAREEWPAK